MRWPWQQAERRSYSAIITEALESAVASTSSGASSAAIEAAGGYLARELASATVTGPAWAQAAITREWRAWAGRETLRQGESLSAIRVASDGRISLIPASNWDWRGQAVDEDEWRVRATVYQPHGSISREFGRDEVIALRWALSSIERYRGRGPAALAGSAATLAKNAESRLSDEASAPVATILAIPDAHGGDDPGLDGLRSSIAKAKGKALLIESTAGGWGDKAGSPHGDWQPRHIGPAMTAELNEAARDGFARMLAACGIPPALFDPRADGTAQREALRRARLNFVEPFAACLADELSRRLEVAVGFEFDAYALDMVSRAQVVHKLTAAGVDIGVAMAAVNLADD